MNQAKWIWLNREAYSELYTPEYRDRQTSLASELLMAEFKKTFTYSQKIVKATIKITADTVFKLWLNQTYIGRGPHCTGGDSDGTCKFSEKAEQRKYYNRVLPYTYVSTFEFTPNTNQLEVFCSVRFSSLIYTEISAGLPGFILSGTLTFADGSTTEIFTDNTWLARLDRTRKSRNYCDCRTECDVFSLASEVEKVWNLRDTLIPNMTEETIIPQGFLPITVEAGAERNFDFSFDKVYSAYVFFEIDTQDNCKIELNMYENIEENAAPAWKEHETDEIYIQTSYEYESLNMSAIGGYSLTVKNFGSTPVVIKNTGIHFIHYPITMEGDFVCSDDLLNQIYRAGKHALSICRQSIHLDSPRHQENLGCLGDYYVESMVEYFAFGDTRLIKFDLLRIADLLRENDGRMFHTTYSLIWVQMLYDCYMFSGELDILAKTEDALDLLLNKFDSYFENGIIENPTDYMFVDWISVDEYSLHHPPKALGQTVLNAFCYKAFSTASAIYTSLGDRKKSMLYEKKSNQLKAEFNKHFYDSERGLYFEGLNTPEKTPKKPWLPENTDKRYYGMHSNSLAVLYGLCDADKSQSIMEKVLFDTDLIQTQPYFMQYVMDAVWTSGLFDKYGLDILRRWEKALDKERKALKEGWIDMPGYTYDLSHAWAATPSYQLPARLLGFKMQEPGFKKISLCPKLFGLEFAEIHMPTPYGMITCQIDRDQYKLFVPSEIEYEVVEEN